MEYVVFRNPRMLYREEEYGGLISIGSNLFIIKKEEHKFLKKLDEKKFILEKDLTEKEKKMIKKFTEKNIIIRVEYDKIKDKIKKVI
ncbi:MAG: hypothetical protein KJ566_03485 [Nanoarchaeota archaeon]|nr:hypothetical protein [Nanoarchaeota archaeon]